jgi:hypothetical protein
MVQHNRAPYLYALDDSPDAESGAPEKGCCTSGLFWGGRRKSSPWNWDQHHAPHPARPQRIERGTDTDDLPSHVGSIDEGVPDSDLESDSSSSASPALSRFMVRVPSSLTFHPAALSSSFLTRTNTQELVKKVYKRNPLKRGSGAPKGLAALSEAMVVRKFGLSNIAAALRKQAVRSKQPHFVPEASP